MKRRTRILVLIGLAGLCCREVYADLDRSSGRIYRVSCDEKSIEFITQTAYDPKTNEGKTRHTIYWNDETEFLALAPLSDFGALKGRYSGRFYYLDEDQTEAVQQGKRFSSRFVEVFDESTPVTGLRNDGKLLSARFTPNGKLSASVDLDGKAIPFQAPGKRFSVMKIKEASEDLLRTGMFTARIFGKVIDGRFVLSSVRLTQIRDPLKTDDPKLPRMLVIGDSISGNYDAAARAALNGIVNYHRISNNGGPSSRGVESIDLWLGDYKQEGFHWDVIQFNHGLHDLKQVRGEDGVWGRHAVELDDYKKNLEQEISVLKKTGAVLI